MASDVLKHQILDEFNEYDAVDTDTHNHRNENSKRNEELRDAHRLTFKKSEPTSINQVESPKSSPRETGEDDQNIFNLNINQQSQTS